MLKNLYKKIISLLKELKCLLVPSLIIFWIYLLNTSLKLISEPSDIKLFLGVTLFSISVYIAIHTIIKIIKKLK